MAEEAEVRVKLVIDDAARATAMGIQQSMGGVATSADHTAASLAKVKSASPFAKMKPDLDANANLMSVVSIGAIGVAAGLAAVGAAGWAAADITQHAFEVALDKAHEVKRVGSALTLMAGDSASLSAIRSNAGLVHEELEKLAIGAGVASQDMIETFATVAERSSMSTAEVMKLTESMAKAGRVVDGGAGALSEGFAMMEAGMIRAKNPVVALIAATGTLHGNAHAVAAQLQKMTPEQAMKKGEEAIEKMAKKVQSMPLGFKEVKQSIADIGDSVLGTMGKPILAAVTDELNAVREFFMKNQETVTAYADAVGQRIGEFVHFIADVVTNFAGLGASDTQSIADQVLSVAEEIGDSWDELKDNGRAVAQSFMDVINAIKAVIDICKTIGRVSAAVMTAGGSEVVRYGAKKAYNYVTESGEYKTPGSLDEGSEKALKKGNRVASDMNAPIAKIDKAADAFRATAKAAGMAQADIDNYVGGMYRLHNQASAKGGGEVFDKIGQDARTDQDAAAQQFMAAYAQASAKHNQAALQHAAMVFESSTQLQKALLDSGAIAAGGLEGLGNMIHDAALRSVVGKEAAKAMDTAGAKGAGGITMNGGQSFNMVQNFKDQDPDRVAIVFRKDVQRAAVSKVQARGTGIYG